MKFGGFVFAAVMAAAKIGAFAAAVGDECIVNGGFEQLTYAANTGGYGGLNGCDTGFTIGWAGASVSTGSAYSPPSGFVAGSCHLALDGDHDATQLFHAPATGTYDLTFRYARRTGSAWEYEYRFTVLVDGVEIMPDGASSATFACNDNVAHTYAASGFSLAQGDHTLMIRGRMTSGTTAGLVDDVSLKVASIESVTPSSKWLTVKGAAFHVDASRTDTMVLTEVNGTNFVNRWNDASGATLYAKRRSATAARGYLDTVEGKPVVNFGAYTGSASTVDGVGGCLDWSSEKSNAPVTGSIGISTFRDIFLVVGVTTKPSAANNQFVLGDTNGYDFHSGHYNAILNSDSGAGNSAAKFDMIEADGVSVPYTYEMRGGINIIHLRAKSGVQAGAFGADRTYLFGGIYYGEVIAYTRALSDEERRSVYEYLYDKWSPNGGAPQGRITLIDYSATNAVFEIAVDFAGSAGKQADVKFSFRRDHKNRLAGFKELDAEVTSGTVITNEIHGLVEGRRYRYACQFVNSKGVYAVTNTFIARKNLKQDVLPEIAPAFHVDAMAAETFTIDVKGGTNYVRRWTDCDVSTRYCSTTAAKPYICYDYFHGYPVVDFGPAIAASAAGTTDGEGAFLQWSFTDSSIRDVFLVFQDRRSAGWQFLLGGTSTYHFHRGGSRQLFNATYNTGFKSGYSIWVDDQKGLSAQYALPEGWHVIRLKPSQNVTANLFGGERISDTGCRRRGDIRLAEAIIYNSALTDAQADKVMKYLTDKWWFVDQPFGPTIFYVR